MGAPNILAAIGAALQQGAGTYGRLNELERERQLQEQERQDRLRQQNMAQMNADREFNLQHQEFAAADAERKRKRIADAIEGLTPNQRVSPELFAQAKLEGLGDRFNVTPGVPSLNIQAGIPADLSSDTPAVTPGQDEITRRPSLKEQAELTEQQNAAVDRARIEKFRAHLASPEHQNEAFDVQQAEAQANGMGNIPLSGKEFERREGIEHKNRIGEIALQNQRPYASQVNGNTPVTDALVQAMIDNPAAFQQLPAKLREKLAGPLANAGFNFKAPPPEQSEYATEHEQRALDAITNLKSKVGATTVGMGGSVMRYLPGSAALRFADDLKNLKSNIMMKELVDMRANSKTGGALGQVSDAEGELLQNALVGLDQAQSIPDVLENLQKAEDSINRYRAKKAELASQYSPIGSSHPPIRIVGGGGQPAAAPAPRKIGRFEIVQ